MADNNKHIIYTAEHIEEYFSGKLLPADMHAMEKAALDDPFLADAMEGYETMHNLPWQEALASAKEEIVTKENTRQPARVLVFLRWWKTTAAVLLIAGGIGLPYFFNRSSTVNKEPADIAAVTRDTTDKTVAANGTVASNAKKEDSADRVIVIKEDNNLLIAQAKPLKVTGNKASPETTDAVANKEIAPVDAEDRKQAKDKASVAAAPTPAMPASGNLGKPSTEEYKNNVAPLNKAIANNNVLALNNRFSATITAPDDTPLPFANVVVINENVGTYADAKGKFKLASADSVLNVRIRAAGYISKVFPIKSGPGDNRIVLSEQEVAAKDIVQFKNKKAAGSMPKMAVQLDTLLNVAPEDGWDNYDTYLSNNFSPAVDKNIHGVVEVHFDVQKDGTLSNVSIAKSLCPACDHEALRVVKEGPQWKVKNGKNDKGTVKVKF